MTDRPPLSDKWLKAAVLGCLWASSEIVLGSFLHNLRIPFSGVILTAIGIVLMVAVSHVWPIPGIIWRAGLVCALMKSISPSAIIFGPMIAIACEALLMEFAIRLLRPGIPAYLLGGALAMSWTLVQVLANTIIMYGTRIVDFYVGLTRYAQRQLGIHGEGVWLPILILLAVQLLLGVGAALLGIVIGRGSRRGAPPMSSLSTAEVLTIKTHRPATAFPYSTGWLLADGILLVTIFTLMNLGHWTLWIPLGGAALVIWPLRYRRSLRQLARPAFWIFSAVLTLLSGFVLSRLTAGSAGLVRGILLGLEMTFRAAVLVIGFSAIGTELRNPDLQRRFTGWRLNSLLLALEAAFETLPLMIANLPPARDILQHPVRVFRRLVSQVDYWLDRLRLQSTRRSGVILLTGHVQEGKTGFLEALITRLTDEGIALSGILSPAVHDGTRHIGYDLVDLGSGERQPLSRISGTSDQPRVGPYFFSNDGLELGQRALSPEETAISDLVVVDEVGPWELRDQGWAGCLYRLTTETRQPMIWVVRESIIDQVIDHWGLKDSLVIPVSETDPASVCRLIRETLRPAPLQMGRN